MAKHFPWGRHEQDIVAVGARTALAQGMSRLEAMRLGQFALPKERRMTLDELRQRAPPSNKMLDNAIARVNAMTAQQIEQLVPPPAAPQAPQATTPPAPAQSPASAPPSASAHPSAGQEEIARVFGVTLANALVPLVSQLLAEHERTILARVAASQSAAGEQLARDMTQLLLEGMDRLLGGAREPKGLEHPAPGTLEHPAPGALEHPVPCERLKVDVIGFNRGHQQMLLKKGLNGHHERVDLRFIESDQLNTYVPSQQRHVVLMTGWVPHKASSKLRSHGIKPILLDKSVSEAVQAISQLLSPGA